ncbi:MAG: MBL fold metallo-hydrolase [Polyangiaceae bacterium]|jgi:phosphoribosyl 1,2-cyclic phosphodiesterase|nr:MBL fold metallo-hydrolase [Polyangiaceae bacterium]
MNVRFWGVRGTLPCPSTKFMKFGGNTSCVEVQVDDQPVVFDAGTGIRPLGSDYLARDVRKATLLLTHTHWDHIHGFPFFAPAFDPKRSFRVMAGHLSKTLGGIRSALAGQMSEPLFPVPLEVMAAKLDFDDFKAGDTFLLRRGLRVRTAPLNHPNGATGYRLEHGGRSVCYVTDTEHVRGQFDANILGLIEGADLVIYDSTYTDAEFPKYVGWGHSTWEEGVRLCRAAGAKRLALFHHDPSRDDAAVAAIERKAKKVWKNVFAAREGTTIRV